MRELGLNDRQIDALRLMVNDGEKMTNKKYRNEFGVSNATAYRDLKEMLDLDFLEETGEGRNKEYSAI